MRSRREVQKVVVLPQIPGELALLREVPEPGWMRSRREVQKVVVLPQIPGELALLREVPGAPLRMPLSWPPGPPKLARLKMLKMARLGSILKRSPREKG